MFDQLSCVQCQTSFRLISFVSQVIGDDDYLAKHTPKPYMELLQVPQTQCIST